MLKTRLGKTGLLVLIPFLLMFLFGKTVKVYADPPSPNQSASKFDHIEMPPMPGQVYKGPGEKAEDVGAGSLPPAVEKIEEQIKRETEILRKGSGVSGRAIESEAGSGPKASESQPEYGSRTLDRKEFEVLPKAIPMTEKQPTTTTGPSAADKGDVKPDIRAPSEDIPSGITDKSAGEAQESPASKDRSGVASESGPLKTSEKAQSETEYERRTSGGDENVTDFLLKRLIIFIVIGFVGFLLMRRYVFKS